MALYRYMNARSFISVDVRDKDVVVRQGCTSNYAIEQIGEITYVRKNYNSIKKMLLIIGIVLFVLGLILGIIGFSTKKIALGIIGSNLFIFGIVLFIISRLLKNKTYLSAKTKVGHLIFSACMYKYIKEEELNQFIDDVRTKQLN